jgi:(p)ppGpp synthase/HD superfamily hydrolase
MSEERKNAILLMREVHGGILDKNGVSYTTHVFNVAYEAARHAKTFSQEEDDLYCIGLLHDVIEDCETDRMDMARRISAEQNNTVYTAVEALTHRAWDSEPYVDYLARVIQVPLARKVKCADLKDNLNVTRALQTSRKNPEFFERLSTVLFPRYIKALALLDEERIVL